MSLSNKSSKNELQEYCTSRSWGYPLYDLVSTDPEFTVRVRVTRTDQKELTAEGSSSRKKEAEKEAASALLCMLRGGMSVAADDMDESQGATPLTNQSATSVPMGKNYRSRLYEYCQLQGLKPVFDMIDSTESPPRFVMQLTVESKVVIGRGNSKKEANEDAAQQMWKLLEEESFKGSKIFSPNYTPIQTKPFIIGEVPPDTRPPIDGLERAYPLGPIIDITKQQTSNQASAYTGPIQTNHIEELENLLEQMNSDMELYFTVVPTDAMTTDLVYLFVNIGCKGQMPAFSGHGKGATEQEARNAAAFNLIEMLPDDFKKNIRKE